MKVRVDYHFVAFVAVDSFLLVDLKLDGVHGGCYHDNVLLLVFLVLLLTGYKIAVQLKVGDFCRNLLGPLLFFFLLALVI